MKITEHFDRLPESVKKTVYERNGDAVGLPENLRAGVESLSRLDLADVRVHYNSRKPTQLDAESYTSGNDIFIAPGQEKHLPHEAWHIVQQRQGRVKPTVDARGIEINEDPILEREADSMGARALAVGTKAS